MKYFLTYLLIINAFSMLLMHEDKRRARKKLWRIPESTLMATAIAGGSVGALLGMYAFRHKTRHRKFTLGIPAILILQIAAAWFLWQKL